MSARIGIELGPSVIRAIRLRVGRPPALIERPIGAEAPEAVVAALGAELGRASVVAVAVELSLLFAKRVELPPVGLPERERILRLDPERYFPVRAEPLAVAAEDGGLVFAARESALVPWLDSFAALGPLERVEAAPQAQARVLLRAGVREAVAAEPLQAGGYGLLVLRDGRLVRARRLFGGRDELRAALETDEAAGLPLLLGSAAADHDELAPVLASREHRPWPAVDGLDPRWLAALGAARGVHLQTDRRVLLPPEHAASVAARRRRRVGMAAAGAVAALLFALGSIGAARDGAAAELDRRIETLRPRAAAVQALQAQLQGLETEARALRAIERERVDPLRVLLALGEALPADAHVRAVRGAGDEWQVEGYALEAAALVPALEAAPELAGVRPLTGSTRVRVNGRDHERFSLAFRLVAAP